MVLRRWPKEQFEDLNGNWFTSTIHCLVSGITKISRCTQIPEGLLLYRGFGGLKLPKQFYVAPESGYKGFVEWGFISTTSDKAIAIQYTGIAKGNLFPTVLQVRPAAVDHGGDIGDFSQFPGEREFLWNPCSLLEAGGEPYMEITPHGIVQIIPVRMNNNVKTMTVEQLREQKKVMHISGFEFLVNEVKIELAQVTEERNALEKADPFAKSNNAGKENILSWIVEGIVEECEKVLDKQSSITPEKFLDDEEYRKLVIEMLETKSHALSKVRLCSDALKQMGGDGSTPLMLAAEKGDVKRVKELIEQKQDLMARNKLLKTALHAAVSSVNSDSQLQVIEALLHRQADVRAKDSDGITALHLAAMTGNISAVAALLNKKGKDLNDKDNNSWTALHHAASDGHLDVLRLLIEASADTDAVDKEGNSALDVAQDQEACQSLLKSFGADGWTAFLRAADKGTGSLEEYLRVRELILCVRDQAEFPAWFADLALRKIRSRAASWTWGGHDKVGMLMGPDKLRVEHLDEQTYSCATGSGILEPKFVHRWTIRFRGVQAAWLGIASGIEDEKGLVSAPGSAGRYMIAFPSNGSEAVVISQRKPYFEMASGITFSSDQDVEFELDTVQETLCVWVDEELVTVVRRVECHDIVPYLCLNHKASATLLCKTILNISDVSMDSIDADEQVGFSNGRWTNDLDEILQNLPIPGTDLNFVLIRDKCQIYP